jgi:hypothetical protein
MQQPDTEMYCVLQAASAMPAMAPPRKARHLAVKAPQRRRQRGRHVGRVEVVKGRRLDAQAIG